MYTDESKDSGENDNFDRNLQYPAYTHSRSGSSVPQPGPSSAPPPGPSVPQGLSPIILPIAPPQVAPVAQGYGRGLSNLAKMYTEESKYSGENDNFDFKLTVFHDICSRADVPEEAKARAFPTMLHGLALDYYYSNVAISTRILTLDDICRSIRAYFEGAEYKQGILARWNSRILKSVWTRMKGSQWRNVYNCSSRTYVTYSTASIWSSERTSSSTTSLSRPDKNYQRASMRASNRQTLWLV